MKKILLFIFIITSHLSTSQIIINGQIFDETTKEVLIGASVVWQKKNIGVSTNISGEFRIEIPEERFPVNLSISVSYTHLTLPTICSV